MLSTYRRGCKIYRSDEVEEFVERTGWIPGHCYRNQPWCLGQRRAKLRFDILEEISKRLPGFPIVLHGASSVPQEYVEIVNKYGGDMPGAKGVPEDMLRKAASMAVCKINIDSDLRLAMTATIRKFMAENPGAFDPRQYLGPPAIHQNYRTPQDC